MPHSISLHIAVSFVLMNTVNMKYVVTGRSTANTELFQLTNFSTTDKQLCGKVELNWMPGQTVVKQEANVIGLEMFQ